ncbi:hypothetical protein [Mesorhizobium sp. M0618]|uniref:hypothetical protein n=1 Tax=unclassified Mesorhizobium TaxID=325217 RepID=UPI00333BAF81
MSDHRALQISSWAHRGCDGETYYLTNRRYLTRICIEVGDEPVEFILGRPPVALTLVSLADAIAEVRRVVSTKLANDDIEVLIVEMALSRGLAVILDRRVART